MQLLNWEFIKAKDARMLEKESKYGGKDNPLNKDNMSTDQLYKRVQDQFFEVDVAYRNNDFAAIRKELVDLSNFAEFLWERVGGGNDKNKNPD